MEIHLASIPGFVPILLDPLINVVTSNTAKMTTPHIWKPDFFFQSVQILPGNSQVFGYLTSIIKTFNHFYKSSYSKFHRVRWWRWITVRVNNICLNQIVTGYG